MSTNGQVQLPSLIVSAQRAAMNIEGSEVSSTSLNSCRPCPLMTIFAPSQVFRSIRTAPIHIIVKNGKLPQKGVVTCDSDKTIVGIHANQVPNVYDVVNNLHAENRLVQ